MTGGRPDHRGGVARRRPVRRLERALLSYDRWASCAEGQLADTPVELVWYTTRERDHAEVLPWDHLDSGLGRDWLWGGWQDALDELEVEDCRWTPCFDCGVCPQLDTSIRIGPTGRTLLPSPRCRRSRVPRH